MSIRVMKMVWDASISPPTNKLVMLAMADWCDDQGHRLHPSMAAIAAKVGVSRGQAQRIVHQLVNERLLSVVANQFGGRPGSTPQYHLHLDRLAELRRSDHMNLNGTDGARATGSTNATGSTDEQYGAHVCAGRVASMLETSGASATQTTSSHQGSIKEPSERPRAPRAAPAPTAPPPSPLESSTKQTNANAPGSGMTVSQMVEDGLTEQTARELLTYRQRNARPLTGRAWEEIQIEASKAGWTVEAAVRKMLNRGWLGLDADWLNKGGKGAQQPDQMAWRKTTASVFAMGESLGVKVRDNEMFDAYERRVLTAFQRHPRH